MCTVLQALMIQDVTDDDDQDTSVIEIVSPVSTPGLFTPYANGGDADYFTPVRSKSMALDRRKSSAYRQASGSSSRFSPLLAKSQKRRNPLDKLHIEVLLKMVLQDAQTRLVFRAQALIQADVAYYSPKEGDLDYPAKISSLPAGPLVPRVHNPLDEDDDDPALLNLPGPDTQGTWYPALRVTLWVLSCLYTYVEVGPFP